MFTVEEITLLDSYRKDSLRETIEEIKTNYQYQEDREIINLIDGLLPKLKKISENCICQPKTVPYFNRKLGQLKQKN